MLPPRSRRRPALVATALAMVLMQGPPARAQSRGELLYSTHCLACHSVQMHWRDKRVVSYGQSLRAQVMRWQGAASLEWSDDDILQVTRHLNTTIYRFPDRVALATAAARAGAAR